MKGSVQRFHNRYRSEVSIPSLRLFYPRQQPAPAHVSQFQRLQPVQQIFNISHCQASISSTPNLPAPPAVMQHDEDRFDNYDYQLFDF